MAISINERIKNQIKSGSNAINAWPKTSYNEFSKRMFMCFMRVFFLQILITVVLETFFNGNGSVIDILEICVPIYTTIFAAVIVKGGVENIFKGFKYTTTSTSTSDDDDDDNG